MRNDAYNHYLEEMAFLERDERKIYLLPEDAEAETNFEFSVLIQTEFGWQFQAF